MSRDKQIEEMKQIIYENTEFDTMWDEIEASAKALYNAGYRKASEVAREIIEEAEKIFMFTCSSLEAYTDWQNFKKKYTEEVK